MLEYHRFNLNFRYLQEQLAYRGIIVSHETVKKWSLKCCSYYCSNCIRSSFCASIRSALIAAAFILISSGHASISRFNIYIFTLTVGVLRVVFGAISCFRFMSVVLLILNSSALLRTLNPSFFIVLNAFS